MIRASPLRRVVDSSSLGRVRAVRRRFATEAPTPAPKKKRGIIRRLVFYTTAATATFYVGSAFVAFKSPQYYEVFVDKVPLGASFLQYAEDHNWDTLTVAKVIKYGNDTVTYIQDFVAGQRGQSSTSSQDAAHKTTDVVARKAAEPKSGESENQLKTVAGGIATKVERARAEVREQSAKAVAIGRHQSVQFSEGVEDLVRKAEAALRGVSSAASPTAETKPSDNVEGRTLEDILPRKSDVYDAPLPIGFEPPPGFSKPSPPKPAPSTTPKGASSSKTAPAPEPVLPPLPLVAPAVSEFSASEPVIAQLASVIDNLASYLNANPSAAEKARDILDTAQVDLKQLAERIEQVKEEERHKLEAQLDEQTRDYTIKLLELEMEAQDKLDSQEHDFRSFFEQEKAKFVQAYREKLNRELQTQSELINERLKQEVIAQGIELQRRWIRDVKIRVEEERGGRLAKLDELATNLKRLERIALDNSAYLDENIRVHALWSALRALNNTVDSPVRTPFREQLRVLRHVAAAREDPVVSVALDTLENSDVPDIGVEPFADLASWFTTSVAPRVTSVALVPDVAAGVLSHLASHLFSSFRFQRHGLVPGSDVLSVLARAEYYLNEKDLDSAARELNQLGGTARELLADWLNAARKRLEVQQALEVVKAEATLASLLVVQD